MLFTFLLYFLACGDKETLDTAAVGASISPNSDSNSEPDAVPESADEPSDEPEDVDQDGVPVDVDCDDNDASIGAPSEEQCDGLDNDCDGSIDESVTTTYYVDVDGDGYGVPENPIQGCELGTGYSLSSDDCDDSDTAIYPGASLGCDGIDHNCDGLIDNDADGDGHADSSCGGSDCDDSDASTWECSASAQILGGYWNYGREFTNNSGCQGAGLGGYSNYCTLSGSLNGEVVANGLSCPFSFTVQYDCDAALSNSLVLGVSATRSFQNPTLSNVVEDLSCGYSVTSFLPPQLELKDYTNNAAPNVRLVTSVSGVDYVWVNGPGYGELDNVSDSWSGCQVGTEYLEAPDTMFMSGPIQPGQQLPL